MKIKKLYLYIFKTFIPLFFTSFAVLLFIVVMQTVWFLVGDLVGKGVDIFIFLRLMFYTSMTAVPLALVLAMLLASLMTYGNLGERLELLAMKTAGIPLQKILKPIFITSFVVGISLFIFQNDYMITSQVRFWQYYYSIKNKSPELAIPEGTFYKEIRGYSIYVAEKSKKSNMMYDMMLYDLTEGFENATVIVADSGKLYTIEDGELLVLELFSGESFRNLRESQGVHSSSNALKPYVRERFETKEIHIPFDNSLEMMDESILSSQFVGKNVFELKEYTDSLAVEIDSIRHINAQSVVDNRYVTTFSSAGRSQTVHTPIMSEVIQSEHVASTQAEEPVAEPPVVDRQPVNEYLQLSSEEQEKYNLYARFQVAGHQQRSRYYDQAKTIVEGMQNRLFYTVTEQRDLADLRRKNLFEYWRKFTYPVACVIFVMIGAPLGALIRKGGLGIPFIVAIFFFIVFYILETIGMKMAREGVWYIWFGMWLPALVLFPIGVFLIYIATKDTMRLNVDGVGYFFKRVFGTDTNRLLTYKEVAIERADYPQAQQDIYRLQEMVTELEQAGTMSYPSFFLKDEQYEKREQLNEQIEAIVKNLSNSRDYLLVHRLGNYPFLRDLSRTMRSEHNWVNILLMILFPFGLVVYGIYAYRNKKYLRELKQVARTNAVMLEEIDRVMKRGEKI